jgi:hypothetical protein
MERFSNSVKYMAAGLLFAAVAVGAGFSSPAVASHDTCSIIAQVPGGEAGAEAQVLAALNATLPLVVRGSGYRLSVYDARWLVIWCHRSTVTVRVPIKVRYSPAEFVSISKRGSARIRGHYAILLGPPAEVCVGDLQVAGLNLDGVPSWVDEGVRSLVNRSDAVDSFCFPVS